MNKQILTALTIISAGIIAGCGSSGDMSSAMNPQGVAKAAVTGKVADGYLVGATVFLDKNGNYQLDAGESSATTDVNGAYTLNIAAADVGKYPILAIATKGVTIDKDTNTAVASTYILSMPAAAVSDTVSNNFISPMSTQLREMMETGTYSSMQDAMSALSTRLGLPSGTNIMTDYMATNNSSMHTAAQNMARLMGSQMSQVFNASGTSSTVDVNRYRGMMGSIFSNISSIKGTGSNSQTAITNLMGSMMTGLNGITPGQPFRNMSTAFRGGIIGGMMGGSGISGSGSSTGFGGMMGGRI